MILKFDSIKDTVSFIQLALYMDSSKAFLKFLKWKKNGELEVNGEVCTLTMTESTPFDQAFAINLRSKYERWITNNKTSTLR